MSSLKGLEKEEKKGARKKNKGTVSCFKTNNKATALGALFLLASSSAMFPSNAVRRAIKSSFRSFHLSATCYSKPAPVALSFTRYENNASDSNAPPVLVLHGLFGSKSNWNSLGKAFHKNTKPVRKVIIERMGIVIDSMNIKMIGSILHRSTPSMPAITATVHTRTNTPTTIWWRIWCNSTKHWASIRPPSLGTAWAVGL